MLHIQSSTLRSILSAIWVLLAQWLEHLTGDQKIAGSILVWGSETFSEFAITGTVILSSKQFTIAGIC